MENNATNVRESFSDKYFIHSYSFNKHILDKTQDGYKKILLYSYKLLEFKRY